MATSARYIDINDLQDVSTWKRLVENVRSTGKRAIIRADEQDIAEVRPAKVRARSRSLQGRPLSKDDPFSQLVGTADSGSPIDIAEHVDEYLAESRADNRQ